jgi:hypothetical protein
MVGFDMRKEIEDGEDDGGDRYADFSLARKRYGKSRAWDLLFYRGTSAFA